MKTKNKGGTYLNHLKLNTVAASYHSDPSGAIRQVLEMLDALKRGYLRKANGRYMNDEHSLIEAFDTTLWKSLEAYDPLQDFLSFFSSNLKRANVSRIRKGGAAKVTVEAYDMEAMADPDERMWTRELLVMENIRDPIRFEEHVQKKRDQRKLISVLLACSDEIAVQICTNYSMYDSDNALARALGIHHSKISRTFTKIRSQFDANRFGPLSDYITA